MSEFLKQLQVEVGVWQRRNFEPRPPHWPAFGIIEELGELDEAIDAWEVATDVETINGSEAAAEEEEEKALDAVKDAIADTIVFAADFCNSKSFDLAEIWEASKEITIAGPRRDVARAATIQDVGRFAHRLLKSEQAIRGTPAEHAAALTKELAIIFATFRSLGEIVGVDPIELTKPVWNDVKQRIWRCRTSGCMTRFAKFVTTEEEAICLSCAERFGFA
jgi:NTP pyrophosphatase (non-canonical NTP hydrolase)